MEERIRDMIAHRRAAGSLKELTMAAAQGKTVVGNRSADQAAVTGAKIEEIEALFDDADDE